MIGLDTSVLVRYLAQDDKKQADRATRLVENELSETAPGFVALVVLVELCWVLKRLYGATPSELKATVRDLLGSRQLLLERRDLVTAALRRLGSAGGDFADAVIAAAAADAGCTHTATFDKSAARLGGFALLS
jgi:predicted nucleic-acid-binding protein